MGTFSLAHWVIVLIIVMIVFGAKRLPAIGSGLGQGIRNFKKSVQNDDALKAEEEDTKAEKSKDS